MTAYDCPQHPYPSPLCLVQDVERIASRETIVGYLPGAPRYEPEPPLRYSLTWQVIRDVLLASVAFAFLAVALVIWLAGAR